MAMQLGGIIDPRLPVQKLRRPQLREILLANGKEVHPDTTGERMRYMIAGEGIDVMPYFVKSVHGHWIPNEGAIRELNKKRKADHKEKMKECGEKEPELNLNALDRHQLMRIAKGVGLEVKTTDTKDSLIEKINGNTA